MGHPSLDLQRVTLTSSVYCQFRCSQAATEFKPLSCCSDYLKCVNKVIVVTHWLEVTPFFPSFCSEFYTCLTKPKPMCDTTARPHFLGGHFGRNCHILVLFTQNFLPLEGNCSTRGATACIWLICFPAPGPRKTNKGTPTNGHFCALRLTTNRFTYPPPPHHFKPDLPSPHLSIPVCPLRACLNVCFRSLFVEKQMASSLSSIQRRSDVGWNLMPTCTLRHVFHTTNGSLLSVCLHCRAKLSTLTPMNH